MSRYFQHSAVPNSGVPSLDRRIIAVLFASIYAVIVSSIPTETFVDYQNYLVYSELGLERLAKRMSQGVLPLLANEPLWLVSSGLLGQLLGPDLAIRLVIFFSAFVTTYVVIGKARGFFLIALLIILLPSVLKNYITHIRQGLGVAFFLIGWAAMGRKKEFFFLCCSVLTHSSLFLIVPLYYAIRIIDSKPINQNIKLIAAATMGALLISLAGAAAVIFGARQATTLTFSAQSVSGIGFFVWLVCFGVLFNGGRRFVASHLFELAIVTQYLVSYWWVDFSARVFESGLIVVLLGALRLPRLNRIGFFLIHWAIAVAGWVFGVANPLIGSWGYVG